MKQRITRWLDNIQLQEHEEKIFLLLAMVVSALIGLVIVGFVVMTERLGATLVAAGPLQRFLTPVAGSLLGGWLLFRFFPSARGSGIPQTRVALVLQKGVIDLRTVLGKFLCSSISLGSGVALGREGPSVHIGAGIASVAARKLGLSEENVKALIPVGTAAAVAAAFNTPLAAVLFTLEEILADLHARLVGAVVIGAATSWIVLRLILGDEPLFHVPAYQLVHPVEFLVYAILGLAGGLVSTVFVKTLLLQRLLFQRVPQAWKPFAPAAGGITVGLLAIAAPGVLGVGYDLVSSAINGQMALQMMALLLILKIVATTTCYGSGNAGGVFGPSLFIGAMLGGVVGQLAHSLLPDYTGNAGAYALVGMGAAFAGIVRTPMTSVIMIFEVTRDYTIIVPLMIANLCSFLLAQRLQKLPLYEALSRQDGIVMPSAAHTPDPLLVESAMQLASDTEEAFAACGPKVHPDDTLDCALQRMGESAADRLPVVSRIGGCQVGVLTLQDSVNAYKALSLRKAPPPAASKDWLPVLGALTLAAVLIISGLVFWQRSRRVERAKEAYHEGQAHLAQGRVDEAVLSFRNALSQTPQDGQLRAALGLSLLQTGHFAEAATYLNPIAKAQPMNGPVWAGLARIALESGNAREAAQHYRRAFAIEWPANQQSEQTEAQFAYARLLAAEGRANEAFSLLLTVMDRRNDDPAIGKSAIEILTTVGTPDQVEQASVLLTKHFPSNSKAWMLLGNARLAAAKETAALAAYREAVKMDPANSEAKIAAMNVDEILRIDPNARWLSVRERASRWNEILRRVIKAAANCGKSLQLDAAATLMKNRALTIEATDHKRDTVLQLWQSMDERCKSDQAVAHVLAKFKE